MRAKLKLYLNFYLNSLQRFFEDCEWAKPLNPFFVVFPVPMQQVVLICLLKSWEFSLWPRMVYCAWGCCALCKELGFLHLFSFFILDTRGCIHITITADEIVLARLANVRLQKRGSMIAGFATQDFCPRRGSCWQTSSCGSWCWVSEAPTLSDGVLAGDEPAGLFHLIHIQQSHPTMVRLVEDNNT